MSDQSNELKNIFEYEIKRKLSQRARSTADEFRILMNGFKFYDYDYTGKVNQIEFVKGILRTGLSGFNESDIRSIFNCYDINNTGYIDYKNFCEYLYGREPLKPLINSQNGEKNTEKVSNEQSNQKQKTPINNGQINPNIKPNINTNNNPSYSGNQNVKENPSQIQQAPKEENQGNLDSSDTKAYFQNLINSFKDQIHTNNGLTYYTLLFDLKNASDQNKNISVDNFVNIFKSLGINILQNDIINFFNLLDFSGKGIVSINDIINTIVDPMNEHRKLYVVNKFAKMDVDKQGEIKVSLLKEKYNPKGHPDVISGKTNEEEIFKQFCYTLDIYCNIREIGEIISYKQFIEYYDGISSAIPDEKYFDDILNGVWDDSILDMNNNDIKNNNLEMNQPPQEINKNINMVNNQDSNMVKENYGSEIPTINNNRYNNQQNPKREKPAHNFNSSFCDENIGINSLFLGESSHVVPRTHGKRGFKKGKPDFNMQNNYNIPYQKRQRMNNNQPNESSNKNNNNYLENDKNDRNFFNKTPISQSQSISTNQTDFNKIQTNDLPIIYKEIKKSSDIKKQFNYNPITNEYTPINVNNTGNKKTPLNQMNNNNFYNKNKNIQLMEINCYNNGMPTNIQNRNNNMQTNLDEQMKEGIIKALNKLKNALIFRGTHILFSFQRKLSLYDLKHQGLVTLDNFINISQAYTMNLSLDESKVIFDLFDKDKKGVINYNELMQTIVGPVNQNRLTIIEKVFNNFNKDNNGKVSINEMKYSFNPSGHPDVINGKKSEEEILGEFLDNLESFKEYSENLTGIYDNCFSLDNFITFYNEVGIGIEDDKKFEFMLLNCWNLDKIMGNNMNNMNNMNNYGEKRYNNIRPGYAGNNINSGNLMARAGSQIINNKGY